MDTMSPISSSAPPMLWQEARNGEGRVYYYNVQTKATQWAKPIELMTPMERALADQPWKEYTADGGRKYWYNTETKKSSWEMPDAYKNALAQAQNSPIPGPAVSGFVAGGVTSLPTYPAQREREDHERTGDRRPQYGISDTNGTLGSSLTQQQTDLGYSTFEDAEAAFMKLLRRNNVQADWTWEQAMRSVIKDPQYRALKDPRDRKAAFDKYVVDVLTQEKDRAKERIAKLRTDFGTMLRSHPEIKHYSRWKTIRPIVEGETIFRSTSDENERRQFFEEYILDLKREHVETEAKSRKTAKEDLAEILKALDLEPYTRWAEAQNLIQSNERIQNEQQFKALTQTDILTAFENHIKSLERTFNDARQQQKAIKIRRERQNRDNFINLLQELRNKGKIKAGTKWMDVLPLMQEDSRYNAILGQTGSTPLDLFRDMIEDEERSLRAPRNDVLDVLDDKRYEITVKTTFDEFASIMKTDGRTEGISRDTLQLLFDRLREKVLRRTEDEKHAANRQQRRAIDALRSKIKHLDPPIHPSDTWEQIKPRIETTEEYRAVESDELRTLAFEKVIRRLKEKEEDNQRDREARDRDRTLRRDYYDRVDRSDRVERGHRSTQSSYRAERKGSSRMSRTPEPDAYEADRRKAQADRERSYRKVSGLSPPPTLYRDRGRDRGRDRDRERGSHYDRDRRDWEDDRDRLYPSRADPRSSRDELDYGVGDVSRSTSGQVPYERRRQRDSETESVGSRSAKRYRRDGRDSDRASDRPRRDKERERVRPRSPRMDIDSDRTAVEKEAPVVHSGSEEGEIEED
ncbi:U1 snRNP protein [Ophidiomyces ophidiicola]|nr:U1 snRNP protein [Ophidiomyces ophidiicola]KAI1989554.1 U1 snRNP protein [Ophidiomyces ophidiicola]KAI1995670.1 U1 snRNP protein [Ophidiomyces ophidiicola]